MSQEAARSDRDFVARAARFGILAFTTLAAIFAVLYVLKGALTPLVTAFVIAYFLDPVIDRLERLGLGRRFAIVFVLALAFVVLGGFRLVVIQRLVHEIFVLVTLMRGYVDYCQAV